jgi:ABC-type multidrug transport system fused ATPase/permease subunit
MKELQIVSQEQEVPDSNAAREASIGDSAEAVVSQVADGGGASIESPAASQATAPTENRDAAKDPAMTVTKHVPNLPQKVAIRDLNFFYGDSLALKNINMPLYAHKVTSFIGPSGCGKSTLLRVLNRMYDLYPSNGPKGRCSSMVIIS